MALTVTIDGADRTHRVLLGSITINQALTSSVDTCTFALRLPAGSHAEAPDFTHEVTIDDDGLVLFAGLVTGTTPVLDLGTGGLEVDVACQDYQYQLSRRVIADAFVNETAGAIVQSVLANAGTPYGLTAGTIEAGPVIQSYAISYEEAGQAIARIAEVIGFEWYVDYAKRLHFFSPASAFAAAEWELTVPVSGESSAPIANLRAPRDGTQYRNAITVRGAQSISDLRTDTRTSSGVERSLVTSFSLVVPGTLTLTINGVPQAVGQAGTDDAGFYQWMVNYSGRQDNLATVTANAGTTTPASGHVIVIQYRHYLPVIKLAQDDDAILERGRFEHVLVREEITTGQLAAIVAAAELERWSRPADVIGFSTTRPGLRAGTRLRVTVARLGVNAEYLLRSVRITSRSYAPDGTAFQPSGYALQWDVEGERV